MKKLAVIFPGVGYTCAKPLLYYTAAMAEEYGYETIRLDYGKDIHSFKGRTPDALKPVTQLALSRVMPALLDLSAASYEEVLFISKSIGTVIACQAEKELTLSRPVRHFLMTPIPATLPYLNNIEGIFFSGTADPYIFFRTGQRSCPHPPRKKPESFLRAAIILLKKSWILWETWTG